ncbi:sugar O-acetyltransferase [Spiroplasma sp. SV19]|uniref:sugar O-acetyltransferase n=1 Tax=Spiroplasma sp. SV19 TaxID=2570468 RepID=UPI0024B7C184|nr:sugar O-acetyltransferase [Spiroplasma sp. SV19]WHQ37029.1 sugar O-acetyltransferase [Spiroplasma sp. SV19]
MTDIFTRDKNGELILFTDPEIGKITNEIHKAQKQLHLLNYKTNKLKKKLKLFAKIINKPLPEGFWFLTLIYLDYGKNLELGKNSFINFGCSFLDRGGITIGDNVLIGPNCNIMTTNHPIAVDLRKATISKKITIENNVWLGANVTVTPCVTIGENSIIAAGSVVTKNIPKDVIAGGTPAKIIKKL